MSSVPAFEAARIKAVSPSLFLALMLARRSRSGIESGIATAFCRDEERCVAMIVAGLDAGVVIQKESHVFNPAPTCGGHQGGLAVLVFGLDVGMFFQEKFHGV